MNKTFNFYICETHEDMYGLEEGNNNYLDKCFGLSRCGWESEVGYLTVDHNNVLIEFVLENWVKSNINRGHYSFKCGSVLYNLYDINNNRVSIPIYKGNCFPELTK